MNLSVLLACSLLPSSLFCWLGPVQISTEGNNCNSHGAINAAAGAEIVWTQGEYPLYNILSSSYIDGIWSAPSTIASGITDDAKVGIDANGNAVAIWTEKQSEKFVIRSSSKPVGQSWSQAVTLSKTDLNFNPQLVMNENGVAIAAWLDTVSNTIHTSYLVFGNAWSPPSTSTSSATDFNLSIDSSGNGYLIWTNLSHSEVYASISNGALFGPGILLESGTYYQMPKISAGDSKNALAIWNDVFSGHAIAMQYSGAWTMVPETISRDPSTASGLSSNETSGFTAWQNSKTGQIEGAGINCHTWMPMASISHEVNNGSPNVSMRQDKSVLIAWPNFSNGHINAVFYTDGSFSDQTALSSEGRHFNMQAITEGMASLVTWQTENHIFANIN